MKDLKEIKYLRKEREKHFLKSDGTMIAQMFSEDVHYLHNGEYKEIDNQLQKNDEYIINKKNVFHTKFNSISKKDELLNIEKDNYYISMYLKNQNAVQSETNNSEIKYKNVLNGIDLMYSILPKRIKESIILNDKNNMSKKIEIVIKTDLQLNIENENIIYAKDSNDIIFTFEPSFMFDSNKNYNNNISYDLKCYDSYYLLTLILDTEWLKLASFPVIIDPTITSSGQNKNVYDTYIFPDDTSINRNNQDVLKIGVEQVNNKKISNRALVKFDLPTIGTGSQIIAAEAVLVGYGILQPPTKKDIITVHNINTDWNEETANWNAMNNKYDNRIEDYTWINMSTSILGDVIDVAFNKINITNLVKHWYSGMPNYGFMLKSYREEYKSDIPVAQCFSKNNTVQGYNPKPYLIVHYRNQNGLENYLEYHKHDFTDGTGYLNLYNGNLTEIFNIGNTIGGKFPIKLDIIYNTNDVILNNNYGYGLGYKLNFHQQIKKVQIEDNELLEYLDADGTLHYFYKGSTLSAPEKEPNSYYDEDGLSLEIKEDNGNYIMKDNIGNKSLFIKNNSIWYLKELTDTNKNKTQIFYDDKNRIIKCLDANNDEIKLIYNDSSIIVNSPNVTAKLIYNLNNQLISLTTNNGPTNFIYDNNKLISKIIDVNGKSIQYKYNQQIPYRLSNLTEYGINDVLGKSFNIKYEFNVTILIDDKGRLETYTFNNEGNNIGIVNSDANEDIKNSYGKQSQYNNRYNTDIGTGKINKLMSDKGYTKTIHNYIENSSFEENIPAALSTSKLKEEVVEGISVTGTHSLKVSTSNTWESKEMQFSVPKNNYYTFSAYIKNNCDLKIEFYYLDSEQKRHNTYIFPLHKQEEFKRSSLTIFYPETAISNLFLEITFIDNGIFYIDDMQLEEGEISNLYNIISNSNFKDGMKNWKVSSRKTNDSTMTPIDSNYEVIKLKSGYPALKLLGEPDKSETLERVIPISGKKGDVFDLYFWYKNCGSSTQYGPVSRHALITFEYVEGSPPIDTFPQIAFNTDNDKWQLFHDNFGAVHDYTSIKIIIFNVDSVNELYLTNFTLFKAIGQDNFVYDRYGNIKEYYSSKNQQLKYEHDKNNQLISITDNTNINQIYEYDNIITDRILRGTSATGITSETKYDEFGNVITNRIYNPMKSPILSNNIYHIRQKGTNNYIAPDMMNSKIILRENDCSNYSWKLEYDEIDYKIVSVEHPNYYVSNYNDKVLLLKNGTTNFDLIKNKNGSYSIKVKNQPLYITIKEKMIVLDSLVENSEYQQFYLEEQSSKLFIENKNTYTSDGKFIKTTTDSLGHKSLYEIDQQNGLIKSLTNPNGSIINYEYNDKYQTTMVKKTDRKVNYQYNNQNLLSKIIFGNIEYQFIYDNFLNNNKIMIGDNVIITNNYDDKNGNLLSTIYGNNNTVSYGYDDLDQLIKVIYDDNEYKYYYNNLSDIAKIDSIYDKYRYDYDSYKRLTQYENNYFKINFEYDNNGLIKNKNYQMDYLKKYINYEYNGDGSITKIIFDDTVLNCIYDELGRIKEKNSSDYKINYDYINRGNKTSYVLEKFKNQDNEFRYIYDNVNNITDIKLNENLINQYEYNLYNELVKDVDYERNVIIYYTYDNVGNLLTKKEYDINSSILLKTDNYKYDNLKWGDQLNKYNDVNIMYDEIGNPIKIGSVNLTWKNGRQLSKYSDHDNNINIEYKYNVDSIRISKNGPGINSKYHLENNHIIIEENGNNVLYYIRDDNDELVGFKYNDTLYYYMKNGQGDIIGILDSECKLIARYQYDAWGQIIKISDSDNNLIDDVNHIAHINPFRYRGYYYDKETNLYYLNSRYYNPVWGRFLNADNVLGDVDQISYNLYSYCGNNPITKGDPDGTIGFFLGCLIIGVAAGFISGGVVGAAKSKQKYNKVKPKEIIKNALIGAVGGGIVGAVVGYAGQTIINYVTTGTPQKVGQIGEKYAGIGRNKDKTSFTIKYSNGKEKIRIPDKYVDGKSLTEIKNVRNLSLTQQIRDYQTIAANPNNLGNPVNFIIKTRSDTQLSGPLQQFIREHNIIVKHLPW